MEPLNIMDTNIIKERHLESLSPDRRQNIPHEVVLSLPEKKN